MKTYGFTASVMVSLRAVKTFRGEVRPGAAVALISLRIRNAIYTPALGWGISSGQFSMYTGSGGNRGH